MAKMLSQLYSIMDKGPLRALSLILALALTGVVFWDPTAFAAKMQSLAMWHGFFIVWAVCSGVIHGVGFKPRTLRWQTLFSPLPAFIIMLLTLSQVIG
jgi:cyd operon protein YbgE